MYGSWNSDRAFSVEATDSVTGAPILQQITFAEAKSKPSVVLSAAEATALLATEKYADEELDGKVESDKIEEADHERL